MTTLTDHQIPKLALIIDDQETMCTIYSKVLKNMGVGIVETALSGKEGIRAYLKQRPDVVLLDIEMPGMGGIDVIQEIRKIDADSNVIMLTSVSDKNTVIQSVKCGAKNYILKTDDVSESKNRLISIFKKLDFNRKFFKSIDIGG